MKTIDHEHSDSARLKKAFLLTAAFTAVLWLIRLSQSLFGLDLVQASIYPRNLQSITGILFAPLLHGSIAHLFANTAPLLVLGTALIYGYPRASRIAIPAIWLFSGLCVWLLARPSWHLGASGLTFGMMFFIFTMGILRWDRRAIALSMIVFLLYGGMIWGVFPTRPGVSWESHLFGALSGLILAFLLRNLDPPPPRKRYSWEEEEDEDWPPGNAPLDGGGSRHNPRAGNSPIRPL